MICLKDISFLPSSYFFMSIVGEIIHSIENNVCDPKEILKWAAMNIHNYKDVTIVLQLLIDKDCYNKDILYSYMIGLNITHGKEYLSYFEKLSNTKNNYVLVAKGYHMYKEREYTTALKLFTEAKYKRGIALIYTALKDKKKALMHAGKDDVLRLYVNSTTWKNSNLLNMHKEKLSKYVLNRIQNNSVSGNSETVDGILQEKTQDSKYIEKLKDIRDKLSYTSELDYFIGKLYHKKQELEKAVEFYYEAYKADKTYLPAIFNICRIKGREVKDVHDAYTAIDDYNAFLEILNDKTTKINTNNCSDNVRKYIFMNKNKFNALDEYKEALKAEFFSKPEILNNMGVITKDESVLQDARAQVPEEYKKYVDYNICLVKKDFEKMKGLEIKQAQEHYNWFAKTESINKTLKICAKLEENDFIEAKTLLDEIAKKKNDKNSLFEDSLLALYYLHKDNTKAIHEICKKNNSFYSLNILAVAYVKEFQRKNGRELSDIFSPLDVIKKTFVKGKGYLHKALEIYKQLLGDIKNSCFVEFAEEINENMGNVCYLLGDCIGALSYYVAQNNHDCILRNSTLILTCIRNNIKHSSTIKYVNRLLEYDLDAFDSREMKKYKTLILLEENKADAEEYAKKEGVFTDLKKDFDAKNEKDNRKRLQKEDIEFERKRKKLE